MTTLILAPTSENLDPILDPLREYAKSSTVVDYTRCPWKYIVDHAMDYERLIYISVLPTHWGGWVPTVQDIADLTGRLPSAHICFDAAEPDWQPFLAAYKGLFTLQATIDGVENDLCDFTWLAPISHEGWNAPQWSHRRLTAAISCHPHNIKRNSVFARAVDEGLVKVRERGGKYSDYANFLMQHRVAMNCDLSGSARVKHVKARVLEVALAECLLLEPENSPMANWFEAGVDYLPYSVTYKEDGTVETDLVAKIEWTFSHAREAEDMARRLHHKVLRDYKPEKFWAQIFERIEPQRPTVRAL